MTLKEIAFRNLLRRKGKAGFVLAGLIIGVSTVVAIISFIEAMTNDINHKLEKYGANILILPKTEALTLSYGGLSLGGVSFDMRELQEKELSRVNSIRNSKNIAAIGPLVLGVLNINAKRILLAGVDFSVSNILKPWWQVQGSIPDDNGILLGSEAARILNLGPGKNVALNGRNLNISGVLRPTGSQDDQLAFTRLKTAQSILKKEGRVSMAEVAALCKDCPIEAMVKQISDALPGAKVMAIQQVVKGRMEALAQFKKFSIGILMVVLLVGGLVVLVTMSSSVRERTEEIGILRAIGFRKRHVIEIVFFEAGILSSLAGIAGYFLGWGVTYVAFRFFSESGSVNTPFNPELAGLAFLIAIFIGIASSAYPASMAARLDPNDALRAL
jgi:putative ABC transport system permease protein